MSTAEELKQSGTAAFGAKRFEEALSLYEQAIALDPQNVDLHNNAAAANHALQRYDAAIACARHSLSIRETHRAHTRVGEALWALNRLPEAAVEYERALALAPGNASIEDSLRRLRLRLLQSLGGGDGGSIGTPSNISTGKFGLLADTIVTVVAVVTMLGLFFSPALARNAWTLLLVAVMGQQALIAHTHGLLKPSKAVLMKWADYRCTLELMLCFTALLSGVGPLMLLVAVQGVFSAVSLAANRVVLANAAPAVHQAILPYLEKITTNQTLLVLQASTMEAIMLFTIMFSGGAIFTLVYIQYVKCLYRIDNNTRVAFSGLRMNVSRLTRNQYMPAFVDTYMQKFCDLLHMLSQQNV
ncbi:TPR Domain containing protein [Trypanosoma grayi]|uniref:TPR Domain containing protein n=1 Tax=Trypanosoma grayi TaxID=71804 RepID=UPI0004F4A565|nr:TPR Domain containing protein [Trypanosoma grayi]KEG11003.1 TPR Domain containing protein [Trypanosoma grayi]